MNRILLTAIVAAGSGFSALAQTDDATKLSQAECESIWNQASQQGAPISEAQAQPYVTDFKAANKDPDGTLSKTEFSQACEAGLVKASASTGEASGEAGASGAQETHKREELHPPTNRIGSEVPTMRSEQHRPD